MLRGLPLLLALVANLGCYEPAVLGLVTPDEECAFSTDGDVRDTGVLDVGPLEALTHSYEAVLLVEGHAGAEVTSASVAFSDADGVPFPTFSYDGRDITLPSVEGERHSTVEGTIGDDGLGTVPFTLVTLEEAAPLQALGSVDGDFEMQIEIRAEVGGRGTTYPYFARLTLCQMCLVGEGGQVDGDAIVCPDGAAPTPVDDAPCRAGQDEVFSTCEDG